jgi:hypothetical protein
MCFNPYKMVMMSFNFLLNKVGDSDEKLAEGIKLYAVPATSTSKRRILYGLISVSLLLFSQS